ncbi:QVR superfamily protein crim [Haematobia irritans]|uniref:QVR superfamily protein crim n=1 Tax=Haematobia irritans TaxID=7368 RepID=UPI003F4FF523
MKKYFYVCLVIQSVLIQGSLSIWCYRCTSATPGCGEEFNWRGIGFLGEQCPEKDDICVKITERRGAQETITRDCLSSLSFRTDIPADKYEGCYPAAKDVRLAHYVNHTIKEHDVKREYFTDVKFCFCFLDHRCNSADMLLKNKSLLGFGLLSTFLMIVVNKIYF